MQSQQTDTKRAGACYVFFRVFPGLREPCELVRYVTLSDAEITTTMEADAARWLEENRALVMENLRRQSQRRMGIGSFRNKSRSPPVQRSFTFPVIARIAGWTYRECFSIGVGEGWWASARFPILVAANARDAADICNGLNHRHRKHPHPDSPRFGWLPAIAFPHDEQLDIGAKIVEAQTGMIRGEAAAVIHSLAAEAVAFHESLQRSQALVAEPSELEDGDDELSPVPLPLKSRACADNWPVDNEWHLREGIAAYLGVTFRIRGIPAKLLDTLFKTRFPCGEAALIDAAEMAGDKGALRSHLTKCRKILRDAYRLLRSTDPIPSTGRGADVTWEIDRELLRRSVETLNGDSTES